METKKGSSQRIKIMLLKDRGHLKEYEIVTVGKWKPLKDTKYVCGDTEV